MGDQTTRRRVQHDPFIELISFHISAHVSILLRWNRPFLYCLDSAANVLPTIKGNAMVASQNTYINSTQLGFQYLDTLRSRPYLPPRNSFVGTCTCITSVEFRTRINIHREICAIPHEIRITYMMFNQTTAKDDRSGAVCS